MLRWPKGDPVRAAGENATMQLSRGSGAPCAGRCAVALHSLLLQIRSYSRSGAAACVDCAPGSNGEQVEQASRRAHDQGREAVRP